MDLPNGVLVRDRTKSQAYKTLLSEWQGIAAGDLKALRGVEEPRWTGAFFRCCGNVVLG